ncbi:MAG: hypothetical protein V2A79_18520 [Planctomycetota bacterium]
MGAGLAVQRILAQRVEFWPLSDRSIHYALLNDPPLRHTAKPESVYAKDRASYHDLTDLLSRAWPNGRYHRRREAASAACHC